MVTMYRETYTVTGVKQGSPTSCLSVSFVFDMVRLFQHNYCTEIFFSRGFMSLSSWISCFSPLLGQSWNEISFSFSFPCPYLRVDSVEASACTHVNVYRQPLHSSWCYRFFRDHTKAEMSIIGVWIIYKEKRRCIMCINECI